MFVLDVLWGSLASATLNQGSLTLSLYMSLAKHIQSGSVLESSGTLIVLRWWLVNNLAESIHGELQNKRHFGCATRLCVSWKSTSRSEPFYTLLATLALKAVY
jgi:hypothetical protein